MANFNANITHEGHMPRYPETWGFIRFFRRMAGKLYRAKSYRLSLLCYHILVIREPNNDNTRNDRGIVFSTLGKYDKAIADFQSALRIYPKNDRAYYNLAVCLSSRGRHAESIKAFQRAIELNNDCGLYYYALAVSQNKAGDKVSALASAKQAVHFGTNEPGVDSEAFEDLCIELEEP